ncbi:MAG: type II toxin-antitoxin system RelE/ParE family toxin [Methyloceanibacter sp.]|nr:type II toxin-antitoxin system RelE/ParE family toxin [Methyloceanibacter sp.]
MHDAGRASARWPHARRNQPGLRSVLVSPHVIFYRVRGDIAQIIRILDGRRDIEDIFADG